MALKVGIPVKQKKINAEIVANKMILTIVLVVLLSNAMGVKSINKADTHIKANAINKAKVPF